MSKAKLALPQAVRIAGHEYTIKLVHTDADVEGVNVGRCDHINQRITLEASCPPEYVRKTLLHELIHAADRRFGGDRLKEAQVLALENGLWAIFRDNPGLARAIFGDTR